MYAVIRSYIAVITLIHCQEKGAILFSLKLYHPQQLLTNSVLVGKQNRL